MSGRGKPSACIGLVKGPTSQWALLHAANQSAATDRTRASDLNHPRTDQRHRRDIVVICDIVSNDHNKFKKNQNDMRPSPNVVICDIVARKKYNTTRNMLYYDLLTMTLKILVIDL